MSVRTRDLLILGTVALAVRAAAVLIVPWPPFTDPAYYSLIAQQLAGGEGFSSPVLWSFIEVGSRIPDAPSLPVPSNAHWMPLTSVVAAASMWLFGPSYVAGSIPLVVISALLVPFTYAVTWELFASRGASLAAALLALVAGPLLIMYPTIDNFAVFGGAGAGSIYAATRAVGSARPGPWLVASGCLAGVATLSRIDGVFLTVAAATAWLIRRGWTRWDAGSLGRVGVAWGVASAAAFLAVLSPWLARNIGEFGRPLPSAGGNTLWITSYNEQFTIGREIGLDSYLEWGALNILLSKLASWLELIGRTGVLLGGVFMLFFVGGLWIHRRRAELAPFFVYFAVMFFAMGALFTFHAPKGAFYHSAPAWLPWAFALAAGSVPAVSTAMSRFWRFLGRPPTHRFITAAGLAGAMMLSVIGSATLFGQWDRSRLRDQQAAGYLRAHADPQDVIMSSDPASLYPLSGNRGVAAPFDPYPTIERVVQAYDVRWVVVTRPTSAETDPLGLWDGARARDSEGNAPGFLPDEPEFEGDDVRVFRVEP